MAVTDEDRRAYITENVAADLQYVLEDTGISLDLQYRLTQHYNTVRVFAAVGDTSADVRRALQTDFALDPAASAANRATLAKLVSAWSLAKDLANKEKDLFAETKILGQPRILQHSERQAMVRAVERAYGQLQDSEIPANEYLALKLEEVENGEPLASALDEVLSRQDKTTSSLQSTLDANGQIRVTKVKGKGKLPESTEDYRRLMKVEAIAWLCMAAKFKSKSWLQNLQLSDFTKYVEYVLGDKVHGVQTLVNGQQTSLKPPWSIVLQYDHKMRKEMFKLVVRGKATLKQALEQVIKDTELKEAYFITPITLSAPESPTKFQRYNNKGGAQSRGAYNNFGNNSPKGKGKTQGKFRQKGKGKSPGYKGDQQLVSQTPDGRDICYAFNSQGCKGQCGRVHVCRVRGCFGQHSAREHRTYVGGGGKSDAKTASPNKE